MRLILMVSAILFFCQQLAAHPGHSALKKVSSANKSNFGSEPLVEFLPAIAVAAKIPIDWAKCQAGMVHQASRSYCQFRESIDYPDIYHDDDSAIFVYKTADGTRLQLSAYNNQWDLSWRGDASTAYEQREADMIEAINHWASQGIRFSEYYYYRLATEEELSLPVGSVLSQQGEQQEISLGSAKGVRRSLKVAFEECEKVFNGDRCVVNLADPTNADHPGDAFGGEPEVVEFEESEMVKITLESDPLDQGYTIYYLGDQEASRQNKLLSIKNAITQLSRDNQSYFFSYPVFVPSGVQRSERELASFRDAEVGPSQYLKKIDAVKKQSCEQHFNSESMRCEVPTPIPEINFYHPADSDETRYITTACGRVSFIQRVQDYLVYLRNPQDLPEVPWDCFNEAFDKVIVPPQESLMMTSFRLMTNDSDGL